MCSFLSLNQKYKPPAFDITIINNSIAIAPFITAYFKANDLILTTSCLEASNTRSKILHTEYRE